ncbi:HD domain-containing protein [Curvibacter sp. CHRR-16]|uniref:HD-GYP domain-containing protein n=1 Tax=Curvibacter sp. CHRR-16 TaxID=2835872 RepID=UPI001BDA53AD|nr:HD domain-containing phosphohydrolase [Curvibacter sp. CHRR-16]MBT0569265.1 HD domain-containing protein [Curvibacter sp. CHRR-16]
MQSNAVAKEEGNATNPIALNAIIKAAEKYTIVASEDIVDVTGMKLWAKNQPVSATLQQRLLERKLSKPLEACLTSENGVTLFTLNDDFERFMDSGSALARGLQPWASLLQQQLRQLPFHSVSQLMLTTALANRPSMVEHAVHAMALVGAMVSRTTQSSHEIRIAMLAGLLHDIGEIYISPEYLDTDSHLDVLGHKHMVVHPRIAQMLLVTTTDYPERISQAIAEHHERLNGSGYPARLQKDDISPLGRMLAVTEVTLGIARQHPDALTRASFALRVLPGEFDLLPVGFISNMAREQAAAAHAGMDTKQASNSPQLKDEMQTLLETAQRIREQLMAMSSSLRAKAIVETACQRIDRMQIAWNSLGCWGLEHAAMTAAEQYEQQLAGWELKHRLFELARESMLMAEKLALQEQLMLSPLWASLDLPAPKLDTEIA